MGCEPVGLIWTERARQNIERLASQARRSGARFRPHFKTHQRDDVGALFRERGIEAITVSSPRMGLQFARDGWDDITLAVPIHAGALPDYRALSDAVRHLHLVTDSVDVARDVGPQLGANVRLWVELDVGQGRTGVPVDEHDQVHRVANAIHASGATLGGLLCHAGHSYSCRSEAELVGTYEDVRRRLISCRESLQRKGFDSLPISYGDTPTCSVVETMEGFDELRPGNGLYYDVQQLVIGSCEESMIAFGVSCPIISVQPAEGKVVIHGGAVHLSKDMVDEQGIGKHFGAVTLPTERGWSSRIEGAAIRSVSQEHGVIETRSETLLAMKPGQTLVILPAHSCLAADLLRAGDSTVCL